MDFELDAEQIALRDAVRGLLTKGSAPESRSEVASTEPGWDTGLWKQLAEMGVLGLPFAESDGGMGAGPIEVMIVAQELGRALAPVPFIAAVAVAGQLIAHAGSTEQRADILGRLSEGTAVPVFAHVEPRSRWSGEAYSVLAEQDDDGWRISGTKEPVPYGAAADILVVSARVGAATRLFLVDPEQRGVQRTGYRNHDSTRSARVAFSAAVATPLGGVDAAAIADVSVRAQAALCAEALGAMERAVDMSVDYLKTRKQFGVPLAAFQALTHRAADMYVSLELARSMALYASMALAEGPADPVIAARAKLQIGRSARHIGQEAIQLHGGIGMTAEYAVGHYASRLVAIEHSFGDTRHQLGVLAATLTDHDVVDVLH